MANTYTNHKGIKAASTDKAQAMFKDTECKGLYLRVYPTGRKVFIHRYWLNGKERLYTMDAPEITPKSTEREIAGALSKARALVAEQKAMIGSRNAESREDPAIERSLNVLSAAAVPTMTEFSSTYMARWAKKKKKSWQEDQRILNVDVLPFIGDMKIDKVEKKHINALLDRKEDAGALIARNRLLSLLHKFFNYAIERGEIKSHINPAAKITKEEETARDRVLTDDEIRMLWAATSDESNLDISTRLAVRLRLITGQRSSEIVNARESDIQGDVWSMDETKNGLAHAIPLTGMALQVIDEARPHARHGLLFPARNGGVMAVQVLSKIFERIPWELESGQVRPTPHDLRRTLRTGLGALNFDNFIQRRVTNHKEKNRIDETYNCYSYLPEKRAALEAWERKLKEILFGQVASNVVPFHKSA